MKRPLVQKSIYEHTKDMYIGSAKITDLSLHK